jgi:hypothetical protein
MASWLAREKRAPVVMVELLEKATRRLQMASLRPPLLAAQWATFRQARSVDSIARRPAVEKQQVRPTLRWALFALRE